MQTEVIYSGLQGPRIIVNDPAYLGKGRHIEIHLSDDGAVFVELWDEQAQEYTASRTVDFADLLSEAHDAVCDGCAPLDNSPDPVV